MRSLADANAQNRLLKLELLDVSQNPLGGGSMTSGISELVSHTFASLTHLVLCSCKLNSGDLDSLSQAKLTGKLPAVKYLDISLNGLSGHLDRLTP